MKFHPVYVALPAVIFVLSIAACAVLIPQIEGEEIVIAFNFSGEPQREQGLAGAVAIFLGLQAAILLTSIGAVHFGKKGDEEGRLLPILGNFLGVGQLIVGLIMLEILWYNSHGSLFLPIGVILGIILTLLAIAPLAFFVLLFFRMKEKT